MHTPEKTLALVLEHAKNQADDSQLLFWSSVYVRLRDNPWFLKDLLDGASVTRPPCPYGHCGEASTFRNPWGTELRYKGRCRLSRFTVHAMEELGFIPAQINPCVLPPAKK